MQFYSENVEANAYKQLWKWNGMFIISQRLQIWSTWHTNRTVISHYSQYAWLLGRIIRTLSGRLILLLPHPISGNRMYVFHTKKSSHLSTSKGMHKVFHNLMILHMYIFSNKYVITLLLCFREGTVEGHSSQIFIWRSTSLNYSALATPVESGASFPSRLHACRNFPSRWPTFIHNTTPASNGAVNSW